MSDLASLSLWGGHLLHGKGAGYLGAQGERGRVLMAEESRGRPASRGPQEVGATKVRAGMWDWGLPSIPSSGPHASQLNELKL